MDNVEFNDDVIVTSAEVHEAILKLGDNKACGLDNITAEHNKLAGEKRRPLVAMSGRICSHGALPDSMLCCAGTSYQRQRGEAEQLWPVLRPKRWA